MSSATLSEDPSAAPMQPALAWFATGLRCALVLSAIAWALNLHVRLDLAIYLEQLLVAVLGLALALTFLTRRSRGTTGVVQWHHWLLAAGSLLCAGYLAARYPELQRELAYRPTDAVVLSALLIGLVVEALRRAVGWPFLVVLGAFFSYALLGHLLPPDHAIRPVELTRLFVYLGIDTNGIIGTPLAVAVVVIVPFLLLGQLLARTGGTDFFTQLAVAVMGRFRGGSAKISIIASTFFGSISGSAVANVASTGVVTIPLMKRSGYSAAAAGGVEAAASTGGQLMPPIMGAAAFLMAEFLQIPYTQVLLAAIVPALLYYAALFIQVDLRAASVGIHAVEVESIPRAGQVLREGWFFPLPFVVFIVALVYLDARPELAVLIGCLVLIATACTVGYRGRRASATDVWAAVLATGQIALEIIVICAAAGVVIGILNLTGLAFDLSLQLVALSGESVLPLLLLAAAMSIVLGMGMPTAGVYVLLASLIAPALIRSGIDPLVAHFFVFYFGMLSMVTPPIALAAFAAANIAGASPWRTAAQAVQLGWSAYVIPFLFVASPGLLLIGGPASIGWTLVTTVGGIWFVSLAAAGYLRHRLTLTARLLLGAAGALVLLPMGDWRFAAPAELLALVLGAGYAAFLMLDSRSRRPGTHERSAGARVEPRQTAIRRLE